MQDNPYILGFTAGELSPWLSTRFDLQAYHRGAALLENFLVRPYGGLCRRDGTEYVGQAAAAEDAIRLFSFCYSESDALMLEFFPGGMRLYRDGVLLCKDGAVYVRETPWSSPEMILSLRFVQVNDVVYVTTPYYPPVALTRYADTNWGCAKVNLDPYPRETYVAQEYGLRFQPEAGSVYDQYASVELDVGLMGFDRSMEGEEYLVCEAPVMSQTLFLNEGFNVGSSALPDLSSSPVPMRKVYHVYNATTGFYDFYTAYHSYSAYFYNGSGSPADYPSFFLAGALRLDSTGNPYEVYGDWELKTHGEWNGLWELWRSYDTPLYEPDFRRWQWTRVRTFGQDPYSERQNWALSGSEDVPCRMLLVCKSAAAINIGAMLYFRILGGSREYKLKIVSWESSRKARVHVESVYCGGARSFYTRKWSFGAFGSRNGYPRFAGLHQGRLWFGGTAGLPTSLFASTVGDYANFRVGSQDDDALHLTLATDDQSRICWICPARSLLVGTSESEWTLSSPDGSALTASNAAFNRQSSVGSENKEAFGVENTVFYVQRGGKRLREISYKLEADGFTSTDTSLLSEHLFASGVKEWVVQRGSSAHVWVLMNDGSLAVLTMNLEQQVTAWQRVSFPGRRVWHMASLMRPGSNEDEVWFVMQNEVSGFVSLERLVPGEAWMDGRRVVALSQGNRVEGGLHLAGLEGYAYPLGRPQEAVEVRFDAQGVFVLPGGAEGQSYVVGSRYCSALETMSLEREASFNAVQQEGRVKLRLLESDPHFEYKASHVSRWEVYDPAREGVSYPFSGAIRISHIPAPGVGQGFCLRVDGTLDFRLLAMTVELDFHGK